MTLFDVETEEEAIRLSEVMQRPGGAFTLDDLTCIPHVSHWHGNLTDRGLKMAKGHVHRAVDFLTDPLEGVFRKVEVVNGDWVFWQEEENSHHRRLHERLVHAVAACREEDVSVSWKMSKDQRRMRDIYGYPNCMEAWSPHITLSVIPGASLDLTDPVLQSEHRYEAIKIAIVRLGKYGTATEIVHSFNLPQ